MRTQMICSSDPAPMKDERLRISWILAKTPGFAIASGLVWRKREVRVPFMINSLVHAQRAWIVALVVCLAASFANAQGDKENQVSTEGLLNAIHQAGDKQEKLSLIRKLGEMGGSESTAAALNILEKGNSEERLAAADGLSKALVFEAIHPIVRLVRSEDDPDRQTQEIGFALRLLDANQPNRRKDDAVANISSLLSGATRIEDRKRILASLAAEDNRCEFGYVVAQAYMSYPGLESQATKVADELARDLGVKPQKLPYWGEYEGVCGGKKSRAMVVPEKHEDQNHFIYRIRVIGDGIDTTMEGRPDKEGVSIDSNGWKGEIRDDTLQAKNGDRVIKMKRHERKSPTLGQKPPAGAIVLLPLGANKPADMDAWANATWRLLPDGSMEVGTGYNTTKQEFASCRIHIEFAEPFMPEEHGQGRGNSGVYLMGRYEIQVLDSFGDNPDKGNCGGIYNNATPLVRDVQLPPLHWQTYDIFFRPPEFDANGSVIRPACFEKVLHNGVLIHENIQVLKPTPSSLWNDQKPAAPLALQDHDHGNPVRFRNIWIVPEGDRQ